MHPPVPESAIMLIAIILPDLSEVEVAFDMRRYEMSTHAVNEIGRLWKDKFEEAWDRMPAETDFSTSPFLYFVAQMPNGLFLELCIDALRIDRGVGGPAETLYLETYEWMTRMWSGRDLNPDGEAGQALKAKLEQGNKS